MTPSQAAITCEMTHLENDPRAFLDDRAVDLVAEYFGTADGLGYTGRAFNSIGGSGESDPNHLTSADIVAVMLLSVPIPPHAVVTLVESPPPRLEELLGQIPTATPLWEVPESVVADGSSADQAWNLLTDTPGVGWVTANKLLARKRPHLLPVYDRVVKAALVPTREEFWVPLWRELQDTDLVRTLTEIKVAAKVPQDVPLLRILDVAVWMRAQGAPR